MVSLPSCSKNIVFFSLFFLVFTLVEEVLSAKEEKCEVCVKFLTRFKSELAEDEKSSPEKIEERFRSVCSESKGKDNRLCYYIGGLEESATSIVGEMTKPLSWGMPAEKVCEKLGKKDMQICELRYEKIIDLKTVDLKKLKVRDLKKVLDAWGESCDGCIEKPEFIKRIEELKPKYMREDL